MKILSQDRLYVLDAKNCDLFVRPDSKIVARNEREVVLGDYQEPERAKEVLKEIFGYIRCKKPAYAMPEE